MPWPLTTAHHTYFSIKVAALCKCNAYIGTSFLKIQLSCVEQLCPNDTNDIQEIEISDHFGRRKVGWLRVISLTDMEAPRLTPAQHHQGKWQISDVVVCHWILPLQCTD